MSDLTTVSRKLVAVFAADVEGYSRLMGLDEVGTLKGLTERRAILDKFIADHRGRIANTAGDSVLAEFGSAVDAVQCAVEAQAALVEANAGIASDRQINFRIGIHIGDVMILAGDLYGDGVNIAARLQAIAKPGSVCISGAAYDQVRKVVSLTFVDLGPQNVKNIEEPVRAYYVDGRSAAKEAMTGAVEGLRPLPDKPSIAVLPFQNLSGDTEQEYFADGMVEDIITALSRFKSLFVIARNSSFTYKGKPVDIKQVGQQLGVRYVLEGSVRKAAGKVRITGQLIDARTQLHLWADHFDGRLDDVFELQDKVTSSVVATIAPRIEQAEIERSRKAPTDSIDAFDLYHRALNALRRFTREANEEALCFARRAILLDADFASAYGVALACYTQRSDENWLNRDDIAEGHHFAVRAVEAGADDAFALARAAQFFNLVLKDPITANAIVDRAVASNPNSAEAWRIRGWTSVYLGQHELAIDQFQRALSLNPLDPQIYYLEQGFARANFCLRRFDVALSWALKSMSRQKNYDPAMAVATTSYAMLGRIADAQLLSARRRDGGWINTASEIRRRMAHFRQEDVELHLEAYRIAGVVE